MKLVLAAIVTLAAGAPAFAQPAGDMSGMPGMAGSQASMTAADGSGVVTAIDAKAGTVTLHHGPIAKLSWPAMTMAFKASPPSLLSASRLASR